MFFLSLSGSGLKVDVDILGLLAGEGDVLDAAGGVAGEGELVVLAGEELGVADDLPVFAGDLLDGEGGAFEGVETPVAADGSGDGEVGGAADFGVRFGWRWELA